MKPKNKGRLFTFGCSFTKYFWPTWADAIADNFSDHQNWANPGAGNLFISNSISECNVRNNIGPKDTVIVMWSSFIRLDYYKHGWQSVRNVISENVSKDIQDIMTLRGSAIRDFGFIAQTKHMLDSLGCEYYFTSMMNIDKFLAPLCYEDFHEEADPDHTADVIDLYREYLDIFLPSAQEIVFPDLDNWFSKPSPGCTSGNRPDIHPYPSEHLDIANSLFPQFVLSDNTCKWFHEEQQKVLDFFNSVTHEDGTYKKHIPHRDNISERLLTKLNKTNPERF